MATSEQIDRTYNYMDAFFRYTYGETADCSGAMFNGDFSQTLQQAQEAKHAFVLRALRVEPGFRLLDVGCGWGPILQAARRRGARGVGLTLSKTQFESCLRQGFEVYLEDWKSVNPQRLKPMDGIVSIGSFEHFCSMEEFFAGRQDAIYSSFFDFCASLLAKGRVLYLQTMRFGKNAPRPHDISITAEKNSNEYIAAVVRKFYPGSWLPMSVEQIVECARSRFELETICNGRRDYIETMNRWQSITWRPSLRKLALGTKLLPRFLLDRDFRYQIECLWKGFNRECFVREMMDHERMVFCRR